MQEIKIINELYGKNSTQLDDCFFFDNKYLITTDTISENTHFKHEWSSARDIAEKLVEVNVSDIASSGGLPILAFLNLGLSKFSEKDTWLKAFLSRFKKKLIHYNIILAGGDTYKAPNTNLTLTLIGKTKHLIQRSSGEINEYLYTTGNLGLSYLGYSHLKFNQKLPPQLLKKALDKHLRPKSRLEVANQLIQKHKISAMMDITDGLIQDSEKLALASNINLEIQIDKLPSFKYFQNYLSIDEILSSGEELELLFLSKEKINSVQNCPITCIGRSYLSTKKPKVKFQLNGKLYLPVSKGFLHF